MITAWIFDLGNTLMSIPKESDEEELLQRALSVPDLREVRRQIYRLCARYPGQTPEEFLTRYTELVLTQHPEVASQSIRHAWDTSVDSAVLSPDAHAILDDLRSSGAKLALVSNTPPTSHRIIDRLDLRRRFDSIVFSCDVGFLKPDPRIFSFALHELGVEPASAVVVGDKVRTDILGGAILGMKTVLLEVRADRISQTPQDYVDAIIPTLADLRKIELYPQST